MIISAWRRSGWRGWQEVQGLRNKEIARVLDRSEVVVKKHVTATLQALGAPNRTKLLVLLSQRGYRVPSMRPMSQA